MALAKMIVSGNQVEVIRLPDYSITDYALKNPKQKTERAKLDDKSIALMSYRRAKKRFSSLLNCNIGHWYVNDSKKPCPAIFMTLTFAENVTDLKSANRLFSKFIQRLNYRFSINRGSLAYICVPEFQQRGAVHYHIVFFNLPYVETDDINQFYSDIWGQGYVDVRAVSGSLSVVQYLSKYMSKSFGVGSKRFFSSRSCLKPVVIGDWFLIESFIQMNIARKQYGKVFVLPFVGVVEFSIYYVDDKGLMCYYDSILRSDKYKPVYGRLYYTM